MIWHRTLGFPPGATRWRGGDRRFHESLIFVFTAPPTSSPSQTRPHPQALATPRAPIPRRLSSIFSRPNSKILRATIHAPRDWGWLFSRRRRPPPPPPNGLTAAGRGHAASLPSAPRRLWITRFSNDLQIIGAFYHRAEGRWIVRAAMLPLFRKMPLSSVTCRSLSCCQRTGFGGVSLRALAAAGICPHAVPMECSHDDSADGSLGTGQSGNPARTPEERDRRSRGDMLVGCSEEKCHARSRSGTHCRG